MEKYDIHVCLVSEQAAANLLPILDSNLIPESAIFLVSNAMSKEAEYLARSFTQKKVKVTQFKLSNVYDFESCVNDINRAISLYDKKNIALNVTGGNKILSIAAYTVFRDLKKDVFYVDTRNKKVSFLYKEDMNSYSKNISLNSKGEMDLYLSSYGVRSIKEPLSINDKFLNEMVSCFIDNYEEYFYYLSWINTYASNIQKFKSELKNELCDEGFILLLKRLKNLNKGKGIIDFDDGIIDFKDAKTRSFMNGGWLEVFIYREISKIKSVEDVSCGLKVDTNIFSNDYDVFDNELDIVFMANNKLHIIECKSGKISANSGNEILYKLDSLKKYGGLMTKVCFVSYSDIPYPVRKRAKNMGIEIIYGKQLKNTKLLIEEWILSRN